jgi:small subunit ribosomal protein S20
MPHHKSAEKRLKTAEKSRRRNVAVKTTVRGQLKRQRTAAAGSQTELIPETHSALDRAARKGVIPKRRAARLKSRTAKNANRGNAG